MSTAAVAGAAYGGNESGQRQREEVGVKKNGAPRERGRRWRRQCPVVTAGAADGGGGGRRQLQSMAAAAAVVAGASGGGDESG